MPIKKGSSDATVMANVKELMAAGYGKDQAWAIALKEAGRGKGKKRG